MQLILYISIHHLQLHLEILLDNRENFTKLPTMHTVYT